MAYNDVMDQHPIPKNVLNVEFKLFGALSVRQFLRVLVGSLLALLIYALPLHPIMKFPLIIISVLVGIGSALVPGFNVRLNGIMRAILVSPRYVWKKQVQVPEVLKASPPKQKAKPKVLKDTASELDDLSIDQILVARSQVLPVVEQVSVAAAGQQSGIAQNIATSAPIGTDTQQLQVTTQPQQQLPVSSTVRTQPSPEEEEHFARIYQEVYGLSTMEQNTRSREASADATPVIKNEGLAGPSVAGTQIPVGNNMQVNVRSVNNTAPRAATAALQGTISPHQKNTGNLLESYREEIAMLQSQLQQLNKTGGDEQKRQQITQRINEIYQTVRPTAPQPTQTRSPMRDLIEIPSKLIYGVVMDKKDTPIQGSSIKILNKQGKPLIQDIITRSDGSFAIDAPLTVGEYIVRISHPSYKFYDFKIVIDNNKLPGYKFRPQ